MNNCKSLIAFVILFLFLLIHSNLFAQKIDSLCIQEGRASFYARFFEGRKTANGEIFRNSKLTAAHKSLPFGTLVRVTNLENFKSVIVRINDRGPYVKNRIIDLTRAAAKKIDLIDDGVTPVLLECIFNPKVDLIPEILLKQ